MKKPKSDSDFPGEEAFRNAMGNRARDVEL